MNRQEIEQFMTAGGVRPSAVRTLVVRLLADACGPLSAQELETELGTVDRSSITRTLSILTEHRLLHAVDAGAGVVRYELCRHSGGDSGAHPDLHPHFHCTHCGRTICLEDTAMPEIPLPAGFRALSANYVIKGVCPDCE